MVESSRADRHIFLSSARIDRSVFRILQSFTQRIFLRGSSGYTVPVVSTRKTSVFLPEGGCVARRETTDQAVGCGSPGVILNKRSASIIWVSRFLRMATSTRQWRASGPPASTTRSSPRSIAATPPRTRSGPESLRDCAGSGTESSKTRTFFSQHPVPSRKSGRQTATAPRPNLRVPLLEGPQVCLLTTPSIRSRLRAN